MCRAHRAIVTATAVLWVAVMILLFVVSPDGGPVEVLTYLLGVMAVVLVPYCLFPWLVGDLLDDKLQDMLGLFIVGWEAAKEDDRPDPDEPDSKRPTLRLLG